MLCIVLGLGLRYAVQRLEVQHLRWAWDFFRSPEEALQDSRRTTLLERTHQAISFARLGRLATLALLIPGLVLTSKWLGADPLGAGLLVCIGAPFIVLWIGQAILVRDFHSASRPPDENHPEWLVDEDAALPSHIAAGWSLWDGLVRAGEALSQRVGLRRPQAYLVEQDGALLMAIGDREFGAINPAAREPAHPDERDENAMIRSIQRLDQTLVREVMRPLNNVTALSLGNLTSEKFINTARRTGFTRFPCYYDQVTNLIGYLNVHDFLETPELPADPKKHIHQPLFLPELARVDLALREMQKARQQIAICFDEHGGCSGLLSREDIIEEITGEIMDEYDRPELKVQAIEGEFLVDGAIDLDDLAESVGLDLSKDTYVTLAGFIQHRLSRAPRKNDTIEERGWTIEVLQLENHRIRRVRLSPPGSEESTDDVPVRAED
jgi:Mg2+/Co2+ transporter CorC